MNAGGGSGLLGNIAPRLNFSDDGILSLPFYEYIEGGLPAINENFIDIQNYYYTLYRPGPTVSIMFCVQRHAFRPL